MKNVSWRFQNSSMILSASVHSQVYGHLAWNCLPKEIRLCDEIEAFKRNLKTHLFVKFMNESTLAIWFWRIIVKRPRMLFAQFVALYKPCKPKSKPRMTSSYWIRDHDNLMTEGLSACREQNIAYNKAIINYGFELKFQFALRSVLIIPEASKVSVALCLPLHQNYILI